MATGATNLPLSPVESPNPLYNRLITVRDRLLGRVRPAAHTPGMEDQSSAPTPIFILTEEAAKILQVSPRTLEGWRSGGVYGPPYIKLRGGLVRYETSAVLDWIREQSTDRNNG